MLKKPFYHCRVEVGKTTWTVVKAECGTDVAVHQRCTAEYASPAFWQSIYKEELIYGLCDFTGWQTTNAL